MLVVMQAHATPEQISAVCEKIEAIGLPRSLHAGRAAHCHRHHRESGRRRARHPGRDARRAGAYPRQQALQAGQPRHQAGKHRHSLSPEPMPPSAGRVWPSSPVPAPLRIASRHSRWPSASAAPARNSSAAALTSRALRRIRSRAWAKQACRSWPRSATNSA